jgi:hypothetical protein
MTEIKEAAMADYTTLQNAANIADMEAERLNAQQNRPITPPPVTPALPTSPVAPASPVAPTADRLEKQQLGSVANDMTQANKYNAALTALAPTTSLPTPGSSNAPSAPSYNPFSRPTDGAGDAAGRASQYDNLMREAADSSGLTKAQREAKIQAAQAMLTPGLAQMQQQGHDYAQQMNALNAGSLPAMFGGQNSGISPDVMKGLFSMFSTNQQPGATPAPGVTPAVPAQPEPAKTVAAVNPTQTDKYNQASSIYGSMRGIG